jgi:hypothetical protein
MRSFRAAPSFVPAGNSQPRAKSILVTEDENVENINFSLVRGGVITGESPMPTDAPSFSRRFSFTPRMLSNSRQHNAWLL